MRALPYYQATKSDPAQAAVAVKPLTPDYSRRDRHRLNNFDLLRLLAAVAVIVSHSFALSGHLEPMVRGQTVGTVGVFVFFGISGFLITQSWNADPSLGRFFAKRALRIYPAYIVVVVAAAVVLGPLVSTLAPGQYFGNVSTWQYMLNNIAMQMQWSLPGVFANNIYPVAVNGSLWSLPYEIDCYLLIGLIGGCGLLRRGRSAASAWAAVMLIVILTPGHALLTFGFGDQWGVIFGFATGSVLSLLSDKIPNSYVAAIVLLAIWLWAPLGGSALTIAMAVSITYAVIVIAHRTPASLRKLTSRGDFSYGLYVWAFPVQQTIDHVCVDHFKAPISSLEMICVSVPVTFVFAVGSWFLVERRAMRLKPRRPQAALTSA